MGGQCTAFAKAPAGLSLFRASRSSRDSQQGAVSSSYAGALPGPDAGAGKTSSPAAADGEAEEGFGSCFRHGVNATTQLLIFVVIGGVLLTLGGSLMLYYGPENTVRLIMSIVPRNPSMAFTAVWIVVVTTSVLGVLPVWVPMAMATPIIFGFYNGWAVNFVSMQLAALGSIAIAQTFLRAPVRNFVASGDYPMVRRAMLVLEDGDTSLMLLVLFRFLCVPLFIKNYGLGALQVPVWKLGVSTIPHCVWMAFLFTSLGFPIGSSMKRVSDQQDIPSQEWILVELLPSALAVAASTAVCFFAHRKYTEILHAEEQALPAASSGF